MDDSIDVIDRYYYALDEIRKLRDKCSKTLAARPLIAIDRGEIRTEIAAYTRVLEILGEKS